MHLRNTGYSELWEEAKGRKNVETTFYRMEEIQVVFHECMDLLKSSIYSNNNNNNIMMMMMMNVDSSVNIQVILNVMEDTIRRNHKVEYIR